MKYPKKWSGVDRGHEGQWAGPVWMQVFNILHHNAGASYQDPESVIYSELSARIPEVAWKGKDETNTGKNRLFFRDAREPWSETGVIKFDEKTGLIAQTELGLALARSEIQADEILRRLMVGHEENGEKPFVTLAQAFLEAGPTTSVSLDELMNGVMHNYRPGTDKLSDALNEGSRSAATFTTTETRRFKHMLSLMESVGAISANGSNYIAWNTQFLRSIAKSDRVNTSQSSMPTLHHLLTTALAAKNFAILAGGTGTGKTRSARQIAAQIAGKANVTTVAVGADWVDNRPLLGFRNLLAVGDANYIAPEALKLILRADASLRAAKTGSKSASANSSETTHPVEPFFLILDEMNLSHVERYFADFLSSMESREPLRLHDCPQGLKADGVEGTVPDKVNWPSNLFVIGTVNIDETTYMFSPKVLDRAHVIEFKVEWDEIKAGLASPPPPDLPRWNAAQTGNFLSIALNERKTIGPADQETLEQALSELYDCLKGTRFNFAHRTARECLNYVAAGKNLSEAGLTATNETSVLVDTAILQKALPKLNGSAGALTKALDKIIDFSKKRGLKSCERKLAAMREQLKSDQFVSFIQ
jgi:hypothetical protein